MKHFTFSILIIAALFLTACSSSSTSTPIRSNSNELPMETQLAVGTLKLAGTDQDITVDQARDLLVYWEVYRDLSQSETAAPAEIDGLVAQIQETMTDAQVQAITDMNLTQQDVFASIQGVTVSSSNASDSTVSIPSGSGNGVAMPAGGPPADGGGAPPDGGGMPVDMGSAASSSGTNQSQSAQAGSASTVTAAVPSTLVEVVIQALQQKIAA